MEKLLGIVPAEIAEELEIAVERGLTAAEVRAGGPDFARTASFLPSRTMLCDVINAVFWASLEHEEARAVLPRIAIGDVRDACRIAPLPLTCKSLRKLSPFWDDASNFVICSPTDAGELAISAIGLLEAVDVSVHAESPGTIVVSLFHRVLAVFEAGEWRSVNREAAHLERILETFFEDNQLRRYKARLLVDLAICARRARRGSMFIMTPPGMHDGLAAHDVENEAAPLGVPAATFYVKHFTAGRDALKSQLAHALEPIPLTEGDEVHAWKAREAEASRLSDLFTFVVSAGAGIDGATLLHDTENDLVPIGFGVKVNADPSESELWVSDAPKLQGRVMPIKDIGGMRHQSAARLVAVNRQAIVVTVSQDGMISLFAWSGKYSRIQAVRHVDLMLRSAKTRRDY